MPHFLKWRIYNCVNSTRPPFIVHVVGPRCSCHADTRRLAPMGQQRPLATTASAAWVERSPRHTLGPIVPMGCAYTQRHGTPLCGAGCVIPNHRMQWWRGACCWPIEAKWRVARVSAWHLGSPRAHHMHKDCGSRCLTTRAFKIRGRGLAVFHPGLVRAHR
jgi:hypothetical protein